MSEDAKNRFFHRDQSRIRRLPAVLATASVLVTAATSALGTDAEDHLPIEDVIDVIRTHEQRIETFSYRCRMTSSRLKINTPEIVWKPIHADPVFESTVRARPRQGQFFADWMERGMTSTDDKGVSFPVTTHRQASCDGKYLSRWYRTVRGRLFPADGGDPMEDLKNRGTVTFPERITREKRLFQQEYLVTGLGWMSPYFFHPQYEDGGPLSDVLRRRVERNDYICAWQSESGLWVINYFAGDHPTVSDPYELEIVYDPAVGRLVRLEQGRHNMMTDETFWKNLEAEGGKITADWIRKYGAFPEERWEVAVRTTFQYEDAAGLLPSRVVRHHLMGVPDTASNMELWEYTDVKQNPELTEVDFQPAFADGVRVTDYARRRIFTAGERLEHSLVPSQRFAAWYGDDPHQPVQPDSTSDGTGSRSLTIMVIVAAFFMVLSLCGRRRPGSPVLLILMFSLAGQSSEQFAFGDAWCVLRNEPERVCARFMEHRKPAVTPTWKTAARFLTPTECSRTGRPRFSPAKIAAGEMWGPVRLSTISANVARLPMPDRTEAVQVGFADRNGTGERP